MSFQIMNEQDKKGLANRLVSKNKNLDVPQGVDRNLFDAYEAWSTLISLQYAEANVRGLLGKSLLLGNAHILIISLGKMIDKSNHNDHQLGINNDSLRKVWRDFSDFLPDSEEKELITNNFNHPTNSNYLSGISFLRNKAFAHNLVTRTTIDNSEIEIALHFCFRSWKLLSNLIPEDGIIEPYKLLKLENWKLNEIFSTEEYQKFNQSWLDSIKKAKNWCEEPIKDFP